LCAIRRRILYKETNCPICKTSLESIVITNDTSIPFENFQLGKIHTEHKHKIYYGDEAKEHFLKIQSLWSLSCSLCDLKNFRNTYDLENHLYQEHNRLKFCPTCLLYRKVFLREQKLYNQASLEQHLRFGDTEEQIKHERCEFCAKEKPFFDKDALYEHMQQKHERCQLCIKQGIMYQYYQDYHALQGHLKREHYKCDHYPCEEVFVSELELSVHRSHAHGPKEKGSNQLKLGFSVSGSITNVVHDEGGHHISGEAMNSRFMDDQFDRDLELALKLSASESQSPSIRTTNNYDQPTSTLVNTQASGARILNLASNVTSVAPRKDRYE